MQFLKNRTNITLAVLSLMLLITTSAIFVVLPTTNAHTPPWTVTTYCYCSAGNPVIGVGQAELLVFWINALPPTASGAYGDRWTFTVDVTKPDGSNDTLGPFTSDPVGGSYTAYTPTQLGNYSVVAHMLEHKITGLPIAPANAGQSLDTVNDTYLGSTSEPVTFTAQQQPILAWQETPLPTDYWQVPVNNMNRNWYSLLGNWLGGAAQTNGPTTNFAYGEAPQSAHIMWTTPYWAGGTMDSRFGDVGYYSGESYEGYDITPIIIIDGNLYYNVQQPPREGWICRDLYTGQEKFFQNTSGPVLPGPAGSLGSGRADWSGSLFTGQLSMGQIYDYESPNQHGGFPYLWSTGIPTAATYPNGSAVPSTIWGMYDASTGNYICSIGNVTQTLKTPDGRTVTTGATGTQVYGQDGSILYYNIVNLGTTASPKDYLQTWNNTYAIWYPELSYGSNDYWRWRPLLNYTFDGSHGFSLNASIPTIQGSILTVREGKYVIGGTAGTYDANGNVAVSGNLWALNLAPGSEGTLLWNITFTPPVQTGNKTVSMNLVDPEDGVFVMSCSQTMQWYVYSLATGNLLWTSQPLNAYAYYGMSANILNGMLLSAPSYAGQIIAFNITTGNILWTYTAQQMGFESPYGGHYPISIFAISDGMIYTRSDEHSPTQPLWRGSDWRCVNATDGTEIWKLGHWGGGSISDGYLVGYNIYDNQIYCVGKGPSATTVSAPQTVSSLGSSVVITGTITDQSSGALAYAKTYGVNGVACVSDANQEAWMEYLYEQQAMPTNITGVPVTLTAIDPNGNLVHIGDIASDLHGNYGSTFTPQVPGTYQIIATFKGSNSYGSSSSTTYLAAGSTAATPAPTATPQTNLVSTTDLMTYMAVGVIAIIVAIAIVGILILRKR